jgi:hypothetical protein
LSDADSGSLETRSGACYWKSVRPGAAVVEAMNLEAFAGEMIAPTIGVYRGRADDEQSPAS